MNKYIRKGFTYLKNILLGFLGFIAVYLLAVFILSVIPVNSNTPPGNDVDIYIKSNGVHTDIVVPVKNSIKDWTTDILYTHTKAQDSAMQYVAFGWGDKGFYLDTPQWKDLKASTAFKAAFYLGTSAMHTSFYKTLEEDKDCVKLTISAGDYKNLVQYISDSFAHNNAKLLWIENRSYGNYDAFYEAKGKYSLFYTCNTWANNALKAANQKAAVWTPYDGGIFMHYN